MFIFKGRILDETDAFVRWMNSFLRVLSVKQLSFCIFNSHSYKHTHPDNPDCSGVPMDISNKANGEVKIAYTYSVSFQVSTKLSVVVTS